MGCDGGLCAEVVEQDECVVSGGAGVGVVGDLSPAARSTTAMGSQVEIACRGCAAAFFEGGDHADSSAMPRAERLELGTGVTLACAVLGDSIAYGHNIDSASLLPVPWNCMGARWVLKR